ncbi:STAS domain-containing protein [Actinorugispora endophytica]|uniref:Anti-sigma factor antagonist n=1 Tax=Actinorugispora endophytica TaxID=1605990 RepID=A0A4R6UJ00_9ACTN|nr:STAS domain-containing protein [Actinorugispora endophytica]TDQ46900.1 anti-sigma B factor antagonist [Actinorugispora endophytica]
MEVKKRTVGEVTVVSVLGDLDGRSAPAAQDRLLGLIPSGGRVLIDMTGVPYMSSAGLRTMLLVYRRAQAVNGAIALAGVSPELRSVMSATGFLEFFTISDTVRRGIEELRA